MPRTPPWVRPAQGSEGPEIQNEAVLCFKCKVRSWVIRLPDVAHLGPVLQEPAVGHLVLPAHVPGVLPQQPDLIAGVPGVPQGVSEMLSWARLRLHSLDKDTRKVLEWNTQSTVPGSLG